MEENTMRYNSSRDRIARSLGVLVGAALVAALVLPSVAQAQPPTPVKPTVAYAGTGPDELTVTTRNGPAAVHDDSLGFWVFSIVNSDGQTMKRAVKTGTVGDLGRLDINLEGSSSHGTWKASVQSGLATEDPTEETRNSPGAVLVHDSDPATYVKLDTETSETAARPTANSPETIYTHGPPEAPENFGYNVTSAGSHLFSWTNATGDTGVQGYRLEWTKDDPALASAKWERAKSR